MGKRFTYFFPRHTTFNIKTEFVHQAPVWIELPYRDVILEPHRKSLIGKLGTVLHYANGDQNSKYPSDRACILWDLKATKPKRLKLIYKNLTLWQDIEFKNYPSMCSICRCFTQLAFACPQYRRENPQKPVETENQMKPHTPISIVPKHNTLTPT
jgi:hypothetical protein